jgi:hypothetical protein
MISQGVVQADLLSRNLSASSIMLDALSARHNPKPYFLERRQIGEVDPGHRAAPWRQGTLAFAAFFPPATINRSSLR